MNLIIKNKKRKVRTILAQVPTSWLSGLKQSEKRLREHGYTESDNKEVVRFTDGSENLTF